MNNKDLVDALALTNAKRKLHGSPALVWSDDCAQTAQQHAENLAKTKTFAHGLLQDAKGRPVGQNLACAGTATWPSTIAVNMWYGEVKDYNFANPGFSAATGHFTCLVWKATTHIGIGKASVGNYTVVCANYWPQGNIRGQYPQNVLPLVSSQPVVVNPPKPLPPAPSPTPAPAPAPPKVVAPIIKTTFPWSSALDTFSRVDGSAKGDVQLLLFDTSATVIIKGYTLVLKGGFVEEIPSEFVLKAKATGSSDWKVIDSQKVDAAQLKGAKSLAFMLSSPQSCVALSLYISRSSPRGSLFGRRVNLQDVTLALG